MLHRYLAALPLGHIASFLSLRQALAVYNRLSKAFSREARWSHPPKLFLSLFIRGYPLYIFDSKWLRDHFDKCDEKIGKSRVISNVSSSSSISILESVDTFRLEEEYFTDLLTRHVKILVTMQEANQTMINYIASTAIRYSYSSSILCATLNLLTDLFSNNSVSWSSFYSSFGLTFARDAAAVHPVHLDPHRYISCLRLLAALYRPHNLISNNQPNLECLECDYQFVVTCIDQFAAIINDGRSNDLIFTCLKQAIGVCINISFCGNYNLPHVRTILVLVDVLSVVPVASPAFTDLLSSTLMFSRNALGTTSTYKTGATKNCFFESAGEIFEWDFVLKRLISCAKYDGRFLMLTCETTVQNVSSLVALLTHLATYTVDLNVCASKEVNDLLDFIDSRGSCCDILVRDAANLRRIVTIV